MQAETEDVDARSAPIDNNDDVNGRGDGGEGKGGNNVEVNVAPPKVNDERRLQIIEHSTEFKPPPGLSDSRQGFPQATIYVMEDQLNPNLSDHPTKDMRRAYFHESLGIDGKVIRRNVTIILQTKATIKPFGNGFFDTFSTRTWWSLLVHRAGIDSTPCDECAQQKGIFPKCIGIAAKAGDRSIFLGACSTCVRAGRISKCSQNAENREKRDNPDRTSKPETTRTKTATKAKKSNEIEEEGIEERAESQVTATTKEDTTRQIEGDEEQASGKSREERFENNEDSSGATEIAAAASKECDESPPAYTREWHPKGDVDDIAESRGCEQRLCDGNTPTSEDSNRLVNNILLQLKGGPREGDEMYALLGLEGEKDLQRSSITMHGGEEKGQAQRRTVPMDESRTEAVRDADMTDLRNGIELLPREMSKGTGAKAVDSSILMEEKESSKEDIISEEASDQTRSQHDEIEDDTIIVEISKDTKRRRTAHRFPHDSFIGDDETYSKRLRRSGRI